MAGSKAGSVGKIVRTQKELVSASPAGACSEVRRPWHSKALESAEFINSFRVHAIRGEPQSSHWLAQI